MIIRRYRDEINPLESHVGLAVLRQYSYKRSSRCQILRQLTCHFKQPGLKDGAPTCAPSFVVNIQRVCLSRICDDRCGGSLTGYVRKGNLSKRRLIGCGVVNHCGGVSRACLLGRLELGRSSDVASASCGIVKTYRCSLQRFSSCR